MNKSENSCNGPECSTVEHGCCSQESPSEQCSCPGCSDQNPIDFAMMIWHKAAMEAVFELKKEKVKQRLAKSHGEVLDKGADAVADALSKMMRSMVQKSSIKDELRGKLSSILSEISR